MCNYLWPGGYIGEQSAYHFRTAYSAADIEKKKKLFDRIKEKNIEKTILFLVEKSHRKKNCLIDWLIACLSAKVKKTSILRDTMKFP